MPNMDPNTTTREVWTNDKLDEPIEDGTHPGLKHYIETNKALLRLLASHSAMRPNLQQTYSTPANLKTKVYFMWDFVSALHMSKQKPGHVRVHPSERLAHHRFTQR